jgi:hypothetical protein
MFPTGTVGLALLLLRSSVAATLVFHMVRYWSSYLPTWTIGIIVFIAVPLVVGAFTPLMAALSGLIELIILAGGGLSEWPFLLLSIGYATALALLGPGAYSFDGRRFGRRLVVTSPLGVEGQNAVSQLLDPGERSATTQNPKDLD